MFAPAAHHIILHPVRLEPPPGEVFARLQKLVAGGALRVEPASRTMGAFRIAEARVRPEKGSVRIRVVTDLSEAEVKIRCYEGEGGDGCLLEWLRQDGCALTSSHLLRAFLQGWPEARWRHHLGTVWRERPRPARGPPPRRCGLFFEHFSKTI